MTGSLTSDNSLSVNVQKNKSGIELVTFFVDGGKKFKRIMREWEREIEISNGNKVMTNLFINLSTCDGSVNTSIIGCQNLTYRTM